MNPLITSVVIEQTANCVTVTEVTASSGVVVNGVTNAAAPQPSYTPSGNGLNIQGRMNPPSLAVVSVSGPTGPGRRALWYHPGPGINGGLLSWTITASGSGLPDTQLFYGNVGSGKFTLTVKKDGSLTLTQN